MPYKDKEKQREAKRKWAEKHRQGSTKGSTGSTLVKAEGSTGFYKKEGSTPQKVEPCEQKVEPKIEPSERGKLRAAVLKVAPVLGIADLDVPWRHLAEYIQEPCPGMPRLERMQRLSGSLGRYADQVYFGVGVDSALNMEEVGKVIGILPPLIGRV